MSGQEAIRAQVVLRRTGLMGIPMMAVENSCASSSTALHLAWQAVASGMHDCALVVGFEKLNHPDRARSYRAVNSSMDLTELADVFGPEAGHERSVFMDIYGPLSTGACREDLDVVELQDTSSVAELQLYEEIGLCADGEAGGLVREQVTWLGGRLPVNPSGGLISRGHPIGATGAAQVVELAWQLER